VALKFPARIGHAAHPKTLRSSRPSGQAVAGRAARSSAWPAPGTGKTKNACRTAAFELPRPAGTARRLANCFIVPQPGPAAAELRQAVFPPRNMKEKSDGRNQ